MRMWLPGVVKETETELAGRGRGADEGGAVVELDGAAGIGGEGGERGGEGGGLAGFEGLTELVRTRAAMLRTCWM